MSAGIDKGVGEKDMTLHLIVAADQAIIDHGRLHPARRAAKRLGVEQEDVRVFRVAGKERRWIAYARGSQAISVHAVDRIAAEAIGRRVLRIPDDPVQVVQIVDA